MLSMRELDFASLIHEALKVEVSTFQFQPASVKQVLTNIKVHLINEVTAKRSKIESLSGVVIPSREEILEIKPGFGGVSVNLRTLWRRMSGGKH